MPVEPGKAALRLVLDTNVVVAGMLRGGPPRRLLELAIDETIDLYSSPVLLDELAHTLAYAKFARRVQHFGVNAQVLVAQYAALVSLVIPATVPRVVTHDADDDHVIAAAVAARADLIATGDRRHLLPIGSHQGVAIVTAREAMERAEAGIKT
ncbi:MAG: putative toxin-antitoxin system toxin component, PIN family [Burkholderiales bacterium]